jgi:hypothetical protein
MKDWPMDEPTKVTLLIPPESQARLKFLMEKMESMSFDELVSHSIGLLEWYQEIRSGGGKIFLQKPGEEDLALVEMSFP